MPVLLQPPVPGRAHTAAARNLNRCGRSPQDQKLTMDTPLKFMQAVRASSMLAAFRGHFVLRPNGMPVLRSRVEGGDQ
jgi:hypothetical protein